MLFHITAGANPETFQPMNVNFGLMPALDGRWKRSERKMGYTDRARTALSRWLEDIREAETV
jgi:methylenetetrahydrofolate--tRNA-(uracil-5-)-methyltransferase